MMLDDANDALDAAESARDTATARVAELEGMLDTANTSAMTIRGQLDTANGMIDDLNMQITAAPTQQMVDDLTGMRDSYKQQAADLQTMLGAANTKADDLQTDLDAANVRLSALSEFEAEQMQDAKIAAAQALATGIANNKVKEAPAPAAVIPFNFGTDPHPIKITRGTDGMVKVEATVNSTDPTPVDPTEKFEATEAGSMWTHFKVERKDLPGEKEGGAQTHYRHLRAHGQANRTVVDSGKSGNNLYQ